MNFEQFTTLLNAAPEQQATRLLTASELQQGLYLEALQYMGKKLPANLQEKQQLVFNQAQVLSMVSTLENDAFPVLFSVRYSIVTNEVPLTAST